LSLNAPAFALDDGDSWEDWEDFDASQPVFDVPEPPPPPPPPPAAAPSFDTPSFGAPAASPAQQAVTPPPPAPSAFVDHDLELFATPPAEDPTGYVRVVRHIREGVSESQDAVIEGLQISVEPGTAEDEIVVTCYFIFRDRPTSYFYDIDRKERTLSFEFVDARTGSSPIQVDEQAPIERIVIDDKQIDANRSIQGLNPEWHNMIRVTFQLEHMPVISVNDQHSIVSFTYKWTTDPEKIPQYIEPNRFPMVFWISGGVLGGIGLGTLTYFLVPKKDRTPSNVLQSSDLPNRF
jgi:hypothetical protein